MRVTRYYCDIGFLAIQKDKSVFQDVCWETMPLNSGFQRQIPPNIIAVRHFQKRNFLTLWIKQRLILEGNFLRIFVTAFTHLYRKSNFWCWAHVSLEALVPNLMFAITGWSHRSILWLKHTVSNTVLKLTVKKLWFSCSEMFNTIHYNSFKKKLHIRSSSFSAKVYVHSIKNKLYLWY